MVKVANDPSDLDSDLPAEPAAPDPLGDCNAETGEAGDSGITLRDVVGLPTAAGATVLATDDQLESLIVRTCSLDQALIEPASARHRLVLARSDPGTLLAEYPDALTRLAEAGAGGLVATAPSPATEPGPAVTVTADLPILILPRDLLDRLDTEVLGAVLDHQNAVLRRLDDLHDSLVQVVLTGGSLDDVCQQLVGSLAGAAMVTTTDGRVLAEAGPAEELDWARRQGCFDRTGRLMTEHEPIGNRRRPGAAAHRAAVRIVSGSVDHGLLVAFSRLRVMTSEDVRLLERAATVAALAITKQQAVSAVESKYRAEFLRDALAGRAGTPAEAILHASSLGWDIDRPMVVVVAETDEDDEQGDRAPDEVRFLQERFAKAWTHAVGIREPASPVMGFSREVVAVLGVTDVSDTERIMRSVGDLVRVVRGDGGGGRRSFSTGVSRAISSVDALPRAYEEALNAVTVGRQMHGHGALTHVDGLGIYRLLALIPDSAQLRRFVDDALGELANDDSPDHADLRQTLRILIDTNMNVAETARLLFFHYNTLRYRITKLEKLLGPFTTDPELRLTLALALKVHQMRGL